MRFRAFLIAVLMLGLLAPALAQELSPGRWIIGEPEGDDLEWVLELERDGTGLMINLRSPGEGEPVTLEPVEPPLYRLPGGYLVFLSETEALVWKDGEAGWARRMGGAIPEAMQGRWTFDEVSVTLEADALRLEGGEGEPMDAIVYPLVSDGRDTDVAVVPEGAESKLVHLRLLPGGVLMLWRHDEDSIWLLTRPDAAPTWAEEIKPEVDQVEKQ